MKIIKKFRRYLTSIIITSCILLVNIGVFYNYYTNTYENLKIQTNNYLNNIVEEAAIAVNIKIDERFKVLEALSVYVSENGMQKNSSLLDVLEMQITVDGFSDYDIINLEGKGLECKGTKDYTSYTFFEKSITGKKSIVELRDEEENFSAIGFVVPIKSDDEVQGLLVAVSTFEDFSSFTDINTFGDNGNLFLIKQNGTLLSRGNGLDEVENISQILTTDKKAATNLISNMKQKNLGNVSYGSDNSKSYLCFSKISYNKWYVVAVVSAKTVEEQTRLIQDEGVTLMIEMGVLFVLLIIYFIYLIASYIRSGQINKQRYFIVTDNSDTVVVDYSISKDTMFVNEKWKELFGYELSKNESRSQMTDYIYEDDKEKFVRRIEKLNKLDKGRDCVKFSVRILDSENNPVSCFVKFFIIKGFFGKPTKILGVIEIINNEYKNFILETFDKKEVTENTVNENEKTVKEAEETVTDHENVQQKKK